VELIILFWITCGIGAGFVGSQKGGSGCLWFFLGFLLGPIGLLMSFAAGPERHCPMCRKGVDTKAVRCPHCQSDLGPAGDGLVITSSPERTGPGLPIGYIKCPDCAEPIRTEARKCRFCGLVLPQQVQGEETGSYVETAPAPVPAEEPAMAPTTPEPDPFSPEPKKSRAGVIGIAVFCALFFTCVIGWMLIPKPAETQSETARVVSKTEGMSTEQAYRLAKRRILRECPEASDTDLSDFWSSPVATGSAGYDVVIRYARAGTATMFICKVSNAAVDCQKQ
jgi:hypothetical protein